MQTRYAIRACIGSKPTTLKVVASRDEALKEVDVLVEGARLKAHRLGTEFWVEERLILTLDEVA